MSHELYKVHRPKDFDAVVGQQVAVQLLKDMVQRERVPHTLLFSGPSGCGKTTLARILARKLKCSRHDFNEMNCADFRGIDTVRDLRSNLGHAPFGGHCRVHLIDECHKLTNDAQNGLLKMLEDTPKHVYFILATTDPDKLIHTIITRCTQISLPKVSRQAMEDGLAAIAEKEDIVLTEAVVDKICDVADGSMRRAVVLLDQVSGLKNEKDALETIAKGDARQAGIEIARAVMRKAKWPEVAKLLKTVKEEPETIRHIMLGYFRSVALGGGKETARAVSVIAHFAENFYDSKDAGLLMACYDAVGEA